jgi:hypothetical protein
MAILQPELPKLDPLLDDQELFRRFSDDSLTREDLFPRRKQDRERILKQLEVSAAKIGSNSSRTHSL